MTLKKRRQLFYIMLAAFFVLGAAVILYVNGWRLDFSPLGLKRIGAIYVRSFPRDARIYLDNRAIKNDSGFLQSGTMINDLFPKDYELRLEYNGYEPWKENVSVSPTLVAEVKYAVLLPKTALVASTGTVKNFWLLGDAVAAQNEKGDLLANGKKIGNGEIVGQTGNLKNILTKDPKTGGYFWNNLDNNQRTNITAFLNKLGFGANKQFSVVVDQWDEKNLILLEPTRISLLDTGQGGLTNIYKTNGTSLENLVSSQFLFAWAEFNKKTGTSTLVIYDKFLKKINSSSEFDNKNKELRWITKDKLAVLQNDGHLYVYGVPGGETTKIADDVKAFAAASDGGAIAALENGSLEIFFYNAEKDYYRFNLPDVERATKIIWYSDSNHLFVVYPDRTAFLDLNDSALKNFATVVNVNRAEYDETNNIMYFLDGGTLKKLEFPG